MVFASLLTAVNSTYPMNNKLFVQGTVPLSINEYKSVDIDKQAGTVVLKQLQLFLVCFS